MNLMDQRISKEPDLKPALAGTRETEKIEAEPGQECKKLEPPLSSPEPSSGVNHTGQPGKPTKNGSFLARARRFLLPILGSLAGTAILAIQTYILHEQTLLLAAQTDLLGIDQSAHIRERIVGASGVDDKVRRLVSALKSESNVQVGTPSDFGGTLKVKDFSVDACEIAACSNSSLDSGLKTLNDKDGHLNEDVARGIVRLSVFLGHIESTTQPLLEAPHELDLNNNNKEDKLGSVQALVASGVTQCFFDPAEGRDLAENMARLRLVSANAFWVIQQIVDPVQFRGFVKKFPQVGTNTEAGVLKLQAAASEILRSAGKDERQGTIQDFTTVLANDYRSALFGLTDLDKACTETIARDSADLKLISNRARR
jgi:hypothetical protein